MLAQVCNLCQLPNAGASFQLVPLQIFSGRDKCNLCLLLNKILIFIFIPISLALAVILRLLTDLFGSIRITYDSFLRCPTSLHRQCCQYQIFCFTF